MLDAAKNAFAQFKAISSMHSYTKLRHSKTTAGLILAFENWSYLVHVASPDTKSPNLHNHCASIYRPPFKGFLNIRWFPAQFFGTCSVKLNLSPVLDMSKCSLDWNVTQGPCAHSDNHTLDHHDHLMMSRLSINQ